MSIAIAKVLYGSQNYGLNVDSSDKDYKVLCLPTFEELYYGKEVSLPKKFQGNEHITVMDMRHWLNLMLKGNVNAIELLYSVEWEWLYEISYFLSRARVMFYNGYLASVWEYFITATKGLVFNSLDRCGINNKSLSRAQYFRDLCYLLMRQNYKITTTTWRNEEIVKFAREIRLNKQTIDVESLKQDFDILKSLPVPTIIHNFSTEKETLNSMLMNVIMRFNNDYCGCD